MKRVSSLSIGFAGLRTTLVPTCPNSRHFGETYQPFETVRDAEDHFELEVSWSPKPTRALQPDIPTQTVSSKETVRFEAPDAFTLTLDPRRGRGSLNYVARPIDGTGLQPPTALHAALKTLWSWWLLHHDGLLLHASGVVSGDGHADLFLGRSGAGKSTLAAMLPPKRLLNDELVAVRNTVKGVMTYATPLTGSMGGTHHPVAAPWGRGWSLSQAGAWRTAPLSTGGALRTIMASAVLPAGLEQDQPIVFSRAASWAQRLRWSELEFSKTPDPDFLREHFEAQRHPGSP